MYWMYSYVHALRLGSGNIPVKLCCWGTQDDLHVQCIEVLWKDADKFKPLMEKLSQETGIKHNTMQNHSVLGTGFLFDQGLGFYTASRFLTSMEL